MSASRKIGLIGVSMKTSFVLSLIASAMFVASLVSTGVTAIPKRGSVCRTSSALPAYCTSLTIR
jgi:hypothetical protein